VLRLELDTLDELTWKPSLHSGTPILAASFHELRLVVQGLDGETLFGEPDRYWNWWITSDFHDLHGKVYEGEGLASEADAMAAAHACAVDFIAGLIETLGGRRVTS